MTYNRSRILYILIAIGISPISLAQLDINSAKQYCKAGDVLTSTSIFNTLLKEQPNNINAKLELGACYFSSGYFNKGSRIFKSILSDPQVETLIKGNLTKFIDSYKSAINEHKLQSNDLRSILNREESESLKIQSLYSFLNRHSDHKHARLKIISLLLKLDRADEIYRLLNDINPQTLDANDHDQYTALRKISDNKFKPRTYFSGKASFSLGYDDNVGGIASNDIYEEEDVASSEKIGGLFTRWYGSLRYNVIMPAILQGERSHTNLSVASISAHERNFWDEEGKPRNYNIFDMGITYGRKNKDNTQLLLPISIKRIELNGEDYAQYFDAKLRYIWKEQGVTLSLTERFSHRDYSQFDEDRQNANLYEGSFGIGIPLNTSFSVNGKIDYTLLDTTEEEFRSYERFTYSLASSYKVTHNTKVTLGLKLQNTDYRGVNDNLRIVSEECIEDDCELLYDYIRSDELTNIFLESNTQLSPNFDLKVGINYVDRESNQELYTYARQTVTVGVNGKF